MLAIRCNSDLVGTDKRGGVANAHARRGERHFHIDIIKPQTARAESKNTPIAKCNCMLAPKCHSDPVGTDEGESVVSAK